TRLVINGRQTFGRAPFFLGDDKRAEQYAIKTSFYQAALQHLPEKPLWGALTGVRPAKAAMELRHADAKTIENYLIRHYDLSDEKAALTAEAVLAAGEAEKKAVDGTYALYINIPFCPTRCRYCSFITRAGADEQTIRKYVTALLGELAEKWETMSQKKLVAFYMGGGTPAVLEPWDFQRIFEQLKHLPGWDEAEKTVELGRTDVTTVDKILVCHTYGIRNVSVNPQSMTPEVLELAGRPGSLHRFHNIFDFCRMGDGMNINCDLIALLPGETPKSHLESLQKIIDLRPERISIHSLAIKRTAELDQIVGHGMVADVIRRGGKMLREAGYKPYYLYRQKNTADGTENVGWALPGKEHLYNIWMMEELGEVIALGAGAVSKKFVDGHMVRESNVKEPILYINKWGSVEEE
ncbi:MAG: coproporphyrinogen dehydrogenase HemZ, partial [Clostridia bacterium]|nr:coproporphyrinogen dehydrogenase HemZ [Clostridia bacterium]